MTGRAVIIAFWDDRPCCN